MQQIFLKCLHISREFFFLPDHDISGSVRNFMIKCKRRDIFEDYLVERAFTTFRSHKFMSISRILTFLPLVSFLQLRPTLCQKQDGVPSCLTNFKKKIDCEFSTNIVNSWSHIFYFLWQLLVECRTNYRNAQGQQREGHKPMKDQIKKIWRLIYFSNFFCCAFPYQIARRHSIPRGSYFTEIVVEKLC